MRKLSHVRDEDAVELVEHNMNIKSTWYLWMQEEIMSETEHPIIRVIHNKETRCLNEHVKLTMQLCNYVTDQIKKLEIYYYVLLFFWIFCLIHYQFVEYSLTARILNRLLLDNLQGLLLFRLRFVCTFDFEWVSHFVKNYHQVYSSIVQVQCSHCYLHCPRSHLGCNRHCRFVSIVMERNCC